MNIYYLIVGIGFVMVSIAHFLSIKKGRGIYFWDKYSSYESTKRDFKVLILFELLTGIVLIFLAIIPILT
jgi:hypothetical protein